MDTANKKPNYTIPQTAILELTYKCNHFCKFCSCPWEVEVEGYPKYLKGDEMDFTQWKKALGVLHGFGVRNISISGGEALLSPFLLDLLDYIRKENLFNQGSDIVLISNGLAMNDDFLKAFKHYDVHLSMSLPGVDTFAQHTGVDNAAGVLHWFEIAKKMGIHTTVNVTVTKLNYHELFKTLAMGLIAGADTVLLNRFLPGGRGLSYINDLMLDKDQLNGMLNIAEEVLEYSNRIGAVGTEFPRCIVDDIDHYKRLRVSTMCAAAKDFFVVDPSGHIRTCNHSPRKIGHIFDTNIVSDVDYWNSFSTRAYIPKKCISCDEVNFCDCGCREVAAILKGRINGVDPCFDNNLNI